MGKVPHRKRLTRRKDRDPRKRKRPPDTKSTEKCQQKTDSIFAQGTSQTSSTHSDNVSKSSHSSNPVSDPVPLTPLVEKLKQHLRRIRYENSSRPDNNTLLIP